MSGLRFKVGELAIVVVDADGEGNEGAVVTIRQTGPLTGFSGRIWDYAVSDSGDKQSALCAGCMDFELRKIDPPDEPASLTRETECEVVA